MPMSYPRFTCHAAFQRAFISQSLRRKFGFASKNYFVAMAFKIELHHAAPSHLPRLGGDRCWILFLPSWFAPARLPCLQLHRNSIAKFSVARET